MIQTIEYTDVKKLDKGIRSSYKQGVYVKNPALCDVVPDGYMTGEEFRKRAVVKVNAFCDKHGIL